MKTVSMSNIEIAMLIIILSTIVCAAGIMIIDRGVEDAVEYEYIYREPDYSRFPPLQFGAYRDQVTGLIYYKNNSTGIFFDGVGNVGIGTANPNNLLHIGGKE